MPRRTTPKFCLLCNKEFICKSNLNRHLRTKVCTRTVGGALRRERHQPIEREDGVYVRDSAFNRYMLTYILPNKENHTDVYEYLMSQKAKLIEILEQELNEKLCLKSNIFFECDYTNIHDEHSRRSFKTKNKEIFQTTTIEDFVDESFTKIEKEMEQQATKKSGWTLHRIRLLELRVNRFQPVKSGSYLDLPYIIRGTESVINPQNFDDNECFKWAVLAYHLNYQAHLICNLRKFAELYNWDDISFPTSVHDVHKFERANNMTINLFALDENNDVYPLKVVDEEKDNHRDLLIIENNRNTHYCFIKNFNKLLGHQITASHVPVHVCKRCFSHFNSADDYVTHSRLCKLHKISSIKMPSKVLDNGEQVEPFVEFTKHNRTHRVPFAIYADFEALLKVIEGPGDDPDKSCTRACQLHEAMSFSVYVKSTLAPENTEGINPKPYVYRGSDSPKKFMEYLSLQCEGINNTYKKNQLLKMKPQDWQSYNDTDKCYICYKHFTKDNYKVRDHDHLTSEYRGAAHRNCNLNFKEPKFVPIFFHNLSGYDSHFLIKELGFDEERVDLIANNSEKYITFSKKFGGIKVQFIDSLRFMPHSLDDLVSFLPQNGFKSISEFFPQNVQPLVKRKGVFCYDFVDSQEKLLLDHLPAKDDFYNHLKESEISDEDYQHAQDVWSAFNIKNLGEYSDLYLTVDVLLLADVFEYFRDFCLRSHGLDPAWYLTAPGLAWDAALKFTGVRLQLLRKYEMLLMIESGIRGGITQCVTRKSEASDGVHIMYFDMNNLYGGAMVKPLPYKDFKFLKQKKISSLDIDAMNEDDDTGYILEVTVEYPHGLHDIHDSLPFLPHHEAPPGSNEKKLLTTFHTKEKYVIHYMALKQALAHGLKLKKIHRVISFTQSCWLKPYIEFNTNMRKLANNKFELEFWKLMNNAYFGKSMEDKRKHQNIELVVSAERLKKVVARPDFLDRTIYAENVVAVHRAKKSILMDKPLYIGFCILDISKTVMYEFLYDKMYTWYGKRCKLLYMDTDSFIFELQTADPYKDMLLHQDSYDTSNYPQDHFLHSMQNSKVLGKMKDEVAGEKIEKIICLRPKMYSIKFAGKVIKRAKGVKTVALQKRITFEDYEQCLQDHTVKVTNFQRIQSKSHIITTVHQRKIGLSPFDNKRFILQDGINTMAYGNFKMPK